jgi:hypothetical protein
MTHSLDSRKLELAKLRLERLKQWGAIVAIVASLGTAIAAHFRPEEDPEAEGVYNELSRAVEKVSEDQLRLHQDVAAIRGYLAGKEGSPKPTVVTFLEPPTKPRSKPSVAGRKPAPAKAIIEEEPEFDVPEVKPPPKVYDAPPVEQVTKK